MGLRASRCNCVGIDVEHDRVSVGFARGTLVLMRDGGGNPQLVAGGPGLTSSDVAALLAAAAPLLATATGERRHPRLGPASRNGRTRRTNRYRS